MPGRLQHVSVKPVQGILTSADADDMRIATQHKDALQVTDDSQRA